jgi:hypothetical protein
MGTTDNYMKARTILSTIDRDIQMMVFRSDVAAFRDSGNNAVFAFYTNAEGAPGGDNRTASLIQYGMDNDAMPTPTLLRYSSGLNFTTGTLTLPAAATPTTVPGLSLPTGSLTSTYSVTASGAGATAGETDPVSNGVILFQWQFIDGAGNVLNPPYVPQPATVPPTPATPFTYDFNNPSTPSNPRTVVVSMVVLSNTAYQLAQSRGTTLTTLQNIFGTTPGANETYSHYWNTQYNNAMTAPTLPAPIMAGLRVFERHIPLPGVTPSSS